MRCALCGGLGMFRVLILLGLVLLSACSFNAKVMNTGDAKVTPLDARTPVSFVLAQEVPVVPEDAIYRGTFETSSNDACTIDKMIDVTLEKARHAGANLVFAKRIKEVYVPGTTTYIGGVAGAMVSTSGRHCVTILADFYFAETPAQAKHEREGQEAKWKN